MERDIMQLIERITELLPKKASKHTPIIVQIIPATVEKWARWKNEDGSFSYSRVELWALVQEADGERYIKGMESEAYMDFIDDIGGFDIYVTKNQMDIEKRELGLTIEEIDTKE